MAFKENKTKRQLEDSVLNYLGITREDLAQSWEEHVEAVDAREEELTYAEHEEAVAEREVLVVTNKSLTDALGGAIQRTLDGLELGTTEFENGQEMVNAITAVSNFIYLTNRK